MVNCPICDATVKEININRHIDSQCESYVEKQSGGGGGGGSSSGTGQHQQSTKSPSVSTFFQPSTAKPTTPSRADTGSGRSIVIARDATTDVRPSAHSPAHARRSREDGDGHRVAANGDGSSATAGTRRSFSNDDGDTGDVTDQPIDHAEPPAKRRKALNALQQVAPLADRMRPQTLDEICGQELVGPTGVLRGLIEQNRVPSMILWGGSGTGKTTIARVISNVVGSRFTEINSTSSGVAECKKIFADARSELGLTGRKTIFFCDEIHRFSKSQQDVFLGPVESGQVTLIGATTENPSFKVQSALLSRCRTFVLQKLTNDDIVAILYRALKREGARYTSSSLVDSKLIEYLAAFSDGDARTALNLLELAMGLSSRPGMTEDGIRKSLTKTLVYDRAGDQHYDTISAFHKSIRGSDPDAALYYLARMLESGEDPLFVARRLIVVASEDIGLADHSMLSLATAAYTATEKIGLPEARINLAHATVAMALSKKSTRVYRSLGNVLAALREPGIAALPIPIHLRNAPTRLMKEIGYGKEYKYNPNYVDGNVQQEVIPFSPQRSSIPHCRCAFTDNRCIVVSP